MNSEPERRRYAPNDECDAPAWPDSRVRRQILAVREALRLRQVARDLCLQKRLYDEHCLFGPAEDARREMMQSLRSARVFWRVALGLGP